VHSQKTQIVINDAYKMQRFFVNEMLFAVIKLYSDTY
jgi:hypothetical protein